MKRDTELKPKPDDDEKRATKDALKAVQDATAARAKRIQELVRRAR